MAIGHLYEEDKPIQHAGNWTILRLGSATVMGYDRDLKRLREAVRHASEHDEPFIRSMIASTEYSLEWLSTGRRPNSYKGIERPYSTNESNVTSITRWDPEWINQHRELYASPNGWTVNEDQVTDQQFRISEALRCLSDRERECYTLHHAFGMDQRAISQELRISRTSVQKYLERAEFKIASEKSNNLFLASW